MALEGVRVIDMTIWQQGPVATAMLADMGAEVIKIEERQHGDPGRYSDNVDQEGNRFPLSFYFESNNRDKKSVAINLKTEAGREVLYRLVKKSDVFASNFRKKALERLGLDYPVLRQHNPRLIYALATGYGPRGPDKDRASNDLAAQCLGGMLSQEGSSPPAPIWAGMADQVAAMVLAYGVVLALFARERTGLGQEVDTSLLGSQILLGAINVQDYLFSGKVSWQLGRDEPVSPFWHVYKTKGDRWLSIGFLEEHRYWRDLCRALGLEHLEKDPRFDTNEKRTSQNKAVLVEILQQTIAEKSLEEWSSILSKEDFVWAPVRDYSEVVNDPQVLENEYIVDVKHPNLGNIRMTGVPVHLSETPGKIRTTAPELGQHTEEVLTEICGYSWDDISRLREAEVI